jgi:hypothetical protein
MFIRKFCKVLALACSCVMAAMPTSMLFQGSVASTDTEPMTGNKTLVVHLFDQAVDGTTVYSESFSDVSFVNGYFAVTLQIDPEVVSFDKQYFLEWMVEGVTSSARIPLMASPYAMRALVADKATLADVATLATSADHAKSADKATLADKSLALDPSVRSLIFHRQNGEGNSFISSELATESYTQWAGLVLNPTKQSIRLTVAGYSRFGGTDRSVIMTTDGIDMNDVHYGIKMRNYGPLVDGVTSCTFEEIGWVVFANSRTPNRGQYICDSNGSSNYYWYKL